jgi:hypothetical protein
MIWRRLGGVVFRCAGARVRQPPFCPVVGCAPRVSGKWSELLKRRSTASDSFCRQRRFGHAKTILAQPLRKLSPCQALVAIQGGIHFITIGLCPIVPATDGWECVDRGVHFIIIGLRTIVRVIDGVGCVCRGLGLKVAT